MEIKKGLSCDNGQGIDPLTEASVTFFRRDYLSFILTIILSCSFFCIAFAAPSEGAESAIPATPSSLFKRAYSAQENTSAHEDTIRKWSMFPSHTTSTEQRHLMKSLVSTVQKIHMHPEACLDKAWDLAKSYDIGHRTVLLAGIIVACGGDIQELKNSLFASPTAANLSRRSSHSIDVEPLTKRSRSSTPVDETSESSSSSSSTICSSSSSSQEDSTESTRSTPIVKKPYFHPVAPHASSPPIFKGLHSPVPPDSSLNP